MQSRCTYQGHASRLAGPGSGPLGEYGCGPLKDVLLSLCWASSPPLRQRSLILGLALCIFYSLHCHPALDFPPSPSHSLQGLSQSSRIACHPLPPQASHVAELLIMPRQSSGSSHTQFSVWPGCPLLPSLNDKLLDALKTRATTWHDSAFSIAVPGNDTATSTHSTSFQCQGPEY